MRISRLAAFVSLLVVVSAVSAAVKDQQLITYYSDASKTTIVGITMYTCHATTIADGQVTPYFDIKKQACATGGPFPWEDFEQYCLDHPNALLCWF